MDPPPEGSVLDRLTLNRTLLARQRLLSRAALPVHDLIEHLVGLQAQVPRDPYISLWSRLRDFEPTTLEALLLERQALRMTLMRTTLHLVTARDAPPLRAVMQSVCEQGYASSPFRRQNEGIDLPALLAHGTALVESRPQTVAELGAALGEHWPGRDRNAMAYAVRYLVPLVQVTPRGLFRRSAAPRVTTLDAWLGDAAAPVMPGSAAPDDTVLRYLRAFGPATVADIRTWSWLTDLKSIVDRLRPRLRSYRDEMGRTLLDVDDGVFASPHEPAPARFTGEYDNVFLAHADRSRITGDLSWGQSYVRKGAFFVDGFLAGAWRMVAAGDRASLSIEPRRPLTRTARAAASVEAEALLQFLARDATVRELAWLAT